MPHVLHGDDFDQLTRKGKLQRLHAEIVDLRTQQDNLLAHVMDTQRSMEMAFANFAAQEDTELTELTALGSGLDGLLKLAQTQGAQLTAFIQDATLSQADQVKLQSIIDQTNAAVARVQAALPQVPPAPSVPTAFQRGV